MNYFYWVVLLALNFVGILVFFWRFGRVGLYVWIGIAAIIANVQVLKTIELFSLVVTLGNIIYGTSFLATDILSEIYGKKSAAEGVKIGIYTLVVVTLIMQLALLFVPHSSDFAQDALATIFGFMPRIAFASITAYYLSQQHDIWAYQYWRRRFPADKQIWIRNNLSTMVSQLIDSVVFTFIAFYGVFEGRVFVDIMITTYFLKWLVAVMDTPFIYLAKRVYKSRVADLEHQEVRIWS